MAIVPGLRATLDITVSTADTATAVGSGDIPVLATPRLLALMEAATVAAVDGRLDEGQTTVGTRVQLEHLRASPVGAVVRVHAEVGHVDGRLVRFEVAAEEADGTLVAHGQITRIVVDRGRFLARLGGTGEGQNRSS
jgi:predicted thioesterase